MTDSRAQHCAILFHYSLCAVHVMALHRDDERKLGGSLHGFSTGRLCLQTRNECASLPGDCHSCTVDGFLQQHAQSAGRSSLRLCMGCFAAAPLLLVRCIAILGDTHVHGLQPPSPSTCAEGTRQCAHWKSCGSNDYLYPLGLLPGPGYAGIGESAVVIGESAVVWWAGRRVPLPRSGRPLS